jgi:alpha-L-fucosidase
MGAWLAKYGESIYGTRGGPFKPGRFGVSTRKGRTIYLHIQHWPGETLTLPAIPAKIVRAVALAGGTVTVKQTDEVIEVALPASHRQEMDTVIALELDRAASAISPVAPLAASQSLATGKKATASNVFQSMAEYGPEKAVDGNSETRWATDSGTKSAWLEVDLGKPVAVGRCFIEQAYPELQRVRKFAIEYWQDGKWQPCYRGENLGATLEATFPPVTAQRVRLNITEATDGPTIWEFELYPPMK